MFWKPPIPSLIPDRAVLRLHRWGVEERTLAEAIDEVCATVSALWDTAPRFAPLRPFFESRTLVEHGAATALFAQILARELRHDDVASLNGLLDAAFLHDVGMSFLPEEFHDSDGSDLHLEMKDIYAAHGPWGRNLVACLEDGRPGLGEKILRHHQWPYVDMTLDPQTLLVGLADSIDQVLMRSAERSDAEVLSHLQHELPPRLHARMHHLVKCNLPGLLFSE